MPENKNKSPGGDQGPASPPIPPSRFRTEGAPPIDLESPQYYLNRELTWLAFNRRVLHEAEDERTPLLERIKFIAIVSSNLDEFFMKRIGGLKQQVGAGVTRLTVDGRSPQQQVDECYAVIRALEARKESLLSRLLPRLEAHGIAVVRYASLGSRDREAMRHYFLDNVYPLLTPQSIDPAHPFPFISNLSLNLLVTLSYPKDGGLSLSRLKVPLGAGVPRFLKVGTRDRFVRLEDLVVGNLDLVFPGMTVEACELFHLTRNANTERDEEKADDLLAMIESELRDRKFAPIVRMTVQRGMDPLRRGMLAAELGLDQASDVFEAGGMLSMRDLWELQGIGPQYLRDSEHHPVDHPDLDSRNIFHILREAGSLLLHHPFESFSSSVERFLKEASEDPKVRALKMTLYRTSSRSKVIDYLVHAAENGKQVAVVVELKARFDEEANIRWASRLEEAGIHVTYGVVGLKTHCKMILVVRSDYDGLRRYVHVGTGNYHADTARLYTDLGLLTSDPLIGQDATELFNYLTTGYKANRNYRRILPAPTLLKEALLAKIEREIEIHQGQGGGLIQFKTNALEDADITRALYRASQAGVRVDLVVRDTCRLRPGIPGLSDGVHVVSVVGRFLEHSRIYYFRNGGRDEYYIGSADCMKRNLEHRVEVVAPVDAPDLKKELREMLDIYLQDRRSAWRMHADGSYSQRRPTAGDPVGSQERLIEAAAKRLKKARRLRKQWTQPGRRSQRVP